MLCSLEKIVESYVDTRRGSQGPVLFFKSQEKTDEMRPKFKDIYSYGLIAGQEVNSTEPE